LSMTKKEIDILFARVQAMVAEVERRKKKNQKAINQRLEDFRIRLDKEGKVCCDRINSFGGGGRWDALKLLGESLHHP
jgi:hypothetical protein